MPSRSRRGRGPARLEHRRPRVDHFEVPRGVGRPAVEGRLGVAAGRLGAAFLHGLPGAHQLELRLAGLGDRRQDVACRVEQSIAQGEAGHLPARPGRGARRRPQAPDQVAGLIRRPRGPARGDRELWQPGVRQAGAVQAAPGRQPSASRQPADRRRERLEGAEQGEIDSPRDRRHRPQPGPILSGSGSAGSPTPAPRTEGTWPDRSTRRRRPAQLHEGRAGHPGARRPRRRRSGSSTPASTTTTTMSDVFFRDLGLPEPDLNLGVGSGSHAAQTAALMVALERTFLAEIRRPSSVVYGDVNSTVAAALVAAKLGAAGRARRGRPAQLRRHDARGDQPARHRPAHRPAVRDHRPRASTTSSRRASPPRPDPLRRQPDDRHAAREPRPVRRRADARRAGPARALRGRDDAPAGQRRRPGAGGADRGDAARRQRARAARRAAPSARAADARGGRAASTATGCGSSSRSATSTSCRWSAAPRSS